MTNKLTLLEAKKLILENGGVAQSQDSLYEQMLHGINVCDLMGLYDLSDYLLALVNMIDSESTY